MMDSVSILAWVLVGAIAGWLASQVIKSDFWRIVDTVVGMSGAVTSGFLFIVLGRSRAAGFDLWSVFVAFNGAVVLLLIIRLLKRKPPLFPSFK